MEFEWDEEKEQKNIAKHGISFARPVQTFRDPRGVDKDPDNRLREVAEIREHL